MDCPHRAFVKVIALSLLALVSAFAVVAAAQSWPVRSARIVVPFQPGGGADIQARILGRKFYESFGQTFVVDNRSGAGGTIGAEIVAKAPPDGYTLLFSTASLAVNATLQKKPGFDPLRDLAPVSWFSSAPLVLVVHPSVPAKTVQELVAIARQHRGKLNAGSNGSGTTSHLAIEMLKQYAGIVLTHVPYKGGGPAAQAIMAGEVDLRFSGQLAVLPHIKAGRVRPLAVASTRKSTIMPELPMLDSIYRGFDADNWYAMFTTTGTPKEVIAKLNAEIVKVLQAPDMRDAISKDGAEPVGSTPEALGAYFRREVDKYAKVIRTANVQVE
jgi:tripartite-type tricarboxylate transporter receptor subunit TctC